MRMLCRPAAPLLALFMLISCVRAGDTPILRIYTWSDYFSEEVLAAFEDRNDCVVAIDLFDSNEEMMEKVANRNGGPAYDIITPSAYMTSAMRQRGMLSPIDRGLIPNLANLDAGFAVFGNDPAYEYSVPYTRTVSGIGYNRKRMPEPGQSWSIFANPALAGRCAMLDDMREAIGVALKHLGHSLNSTNPAELDGARALLLLWLGNAAAHSPVEIALGLGAGDYDAVQAYNGDIAVLMEENGDLDFFVPKEGSAITSDDFVIPAGSSNRKLAHALINHMLSPDNAAANMASTLYYMPVPKALELLDDGIRRSHAFDIPAETLAKCEVVRDVGENTKLYEAVWAEVKKARNRK